MARIARVALCLLVLATAALAQDTATSAASVSAASASAAAIQSAVSASAGALGTVVACNGWASVACTCNFAPRQVLCNGLGLSVLPIGIPVDIIELQLNNNQLTDLPSLTAFTKLTTLYMEHNSFASMPVTAFAPTLPSLRAM